MKAWCLAAIALLLAAAPRPAFATCEIKSGDAVRAKGEILSAWLNRRGEPFYMLDMDPQSCDGEITFIRGPGSQLQCQTGQEAVVVGHYEPVTFDFTGSGYLIRAESLSCG
ncbi:MAG TPA: hypothetical protein VMG55_01540 [Stellaceae bacterium]|nr:hypothetical protein [Stellaceae bacterium]